MKRRLFLLALPSMALQSPASNAAALPHLTVYRDPGCGCCEGWVEHMRDAGFTADIVDDPERATRRATLGISDDNASCHTAVFGNAAIEGHVPAAATATATATAKVTPVDLVGMDLDDLRDTFPVRTRIVDRGRDTTEYIA